MRTRFSSFTSSPGQRLFEGFEDLALALRVEERLPADVGVGRAPVVQRQCVFDRDQSSVFDHDACSSLRSAQRSGASALRQPSVAGYARRALRGIPMVRFSHGAESDPRVAIPGRRGFPPGGS